MIVESSPGGKELHWTGPMARQHHKAQVEYLRSCLPAEVLELAKK